ncbi:hypothetical protein J437_LFUL015509 [Ladona fulva]|uniref:Caprin-1 dimerization domain-containing protein n=1 Tax=Ladona fulva TaxID=123851 RepID=A0A8K0KJ94_LADFU|nr:hypothetical protein J437_LFUL015509 [Ladona fulva]
MRMPSASAKLEKQASTEAVDPLRQAITVIDHKIRNLEKRKVKLESYKEEQKNGKELNSDQFSAVAKYDEVLQCLDFARELCKQFNSIAADAAKALKKQQRKEQLERTQQEISRVKEILVIQEVLLNVGQETVREDFLAARNGACQLTEEDIKSLDDLYLLLSPKHIPEENMPPYQEQLTHSAEHLIHLVEGRQKEVVGTTYASLKELIARIHTCGYFDQSPEEEEEAVAAVAAGDEATEPSLQQDEPHVESYVDPVTVQQETMEPSLAGAAAPEILPPQPNLNPAIPPEASFFTPPAPTPNVSSGNPPFPPHPSSAAPMQQQQPMPQPQGHTLPENFDSGFDFIQESQLEVEAPVPPHVDLAGMLVQQPGAGHPPVPPAHFRPSRPGVPQQTSVAPNIQPPQSSQLAPVVAEFVASVTAPTTPPIPSQTFTNQNFSILPVPGSAQPVVASPTPGIAPPNFPEASAPVSAQMPPAQQSNPSTQHIPAFARASSNSFQAPVQGMSTTDSNPNQPIPMSMPQQRVSEDSEYATNSAAPFVPASVAQSAYSGQGQQQSQAFVPQQQAMGQGRFPNTYGDTSHVSAAGDSGGDKARFAAAEMSGEAPEETDLQTSTSWADTSQEEVCPPYNQNQRGGYGRGGRGGMMRGRSNSNGFGGRGRGNYQNGRGGYGGGGYRGNQEGGNAYYQNGYQQRDNFGNNSGGGYGNSGFKSGGRGGGSGPSGNGGMQRGGGLNRGRGGGGSGRGTNMRGGRGNYVRGGAGGNKQ